MLSMPGSVYECEHVHVSPIREHAHTHSGDLAGKLSGYFGARYLAKERIFDSLISIFSTLYTT